MLAVAACAASASARLRFVWLNRKAGSFPTSWNQGEGRSGAGGSGGSSLLVMAALNRSVRPHEHQWINYSGGSGRDDRSRATTSREHVYMCIYEGPAIACRLASGVWFSFRRSRGEPWL